MGVKTSHSKCSTNHYSNPGFFSYPIISLLAILIFLLFANQGICQQNKPTDTLNLSPKDSVLTPIHSPAKASMYSMILPGLGQAYNKKYWKIPIIYAGFGAFYYFIRLNNKEYQLWREGYYHALQYPGGVEPPLNDYEALYFDDTDFMKANKDFYRRNRDLTYILSAVWYLLNVVDATVDAHLFNWDVSDNLSMRLEPRFYNNTIPGIKATGGMQLTLQF